MNTAIVIGLSATVLYLGKRWLGARAEVSELLVQNALLKRRIARSAR
ncbi:MAG: hypothetical protein WBO00_10885 [Steroidobacteraceae bacterium]